MSELINTHDNRATIRWKLLTGVSALALTAYISSASLAKAEDADHPTLWIELGGQMEQVEGLTAPVTAPFMTAITPTPGPYADDIFTANQKAPRFSFGEEGKISFLPENSDWMFSASLRYGRSNTHQHKHHQSAAAVKTLFSNDQLYTHEFPASPFADAKGAYDESHLVLDFMVGKDVGLGAFGQDGSSSISAGVRIVQFSAKSSFTGIGRPSIQFVQRGNWYGEITFFNYTMAANASRNFDGAGPSLSWNASAALAGNKEDGELTLDWGIDGAVLFGRQKAKVSHVTQAYHLPSAYYFWYQGLYYTRTYHNSPHHARSRSVVVPNLGGSVGLSMKYPNVKFSVGYRYDTFIGAMDTGIDIAKKSSLTFNGPYASISVGLGD